MDSPELFDLIPETKKQLLHLQTLAVDGAHISAPLEIVRAASRPEAVPVSRTTPKPASASRTLDTLFGNLAPQPEKLAASQETFEAIRTEIGDCTRCPLHRERTTVVHTEGNRKARLMFVGEA